MVQLQAPWEGEAALINSYSYTSTAAASVITSHTSEYPCCIVMVGTTRTPVQCSMAG